MKADAIVLGIIIVVLLVEVFIVTKKERIL